jgi:heme-degrading monooxygenase HmoA
MDFRIAVPIERAEEFKANLFDFLEGLTQAGLDGFAVHRAEPDGDAVIQHVYFESEQAADAFRSRWSEEWIR